MGTPKWTDTTHSIPPLTLEENLRSKGLNPEDFAFYTDGFRFGAPPHAGWGLGVARLLMVLTGSRNVRETVLFPRDRHRVTP